MPPEVEIKGNDEIAQALKEFELKAKQEENIAIVEPMKNKEMPKMARLVIKYSGGAIKDEQTAEYVLLAFILFAVVLSLYFLYLSFGGGRPEPKMSPLMMEAMKRYSSH
ncbi:MAG: hypothetical protein WCI76_00735 [bacterium]